MIVRNYHDLDISALPTRGLRPAYGFLDPTITAHGRRWRQWYRLRVFLCCFGRCNRLAGNCIGINTATRIRVCPGYEGIEAACTHKGDLVVTRSDRPILRIADRVPSAPIDRESWRGRGCGPGGRCECGR